MKLVSFGQVGVERAGVLKEGGIVDISTADPSLQTTYWESWKQALWTRLRI